MQVELLGKKSHVLVATPGRLLDLADSGAVDLGAHNDSTCQAHSSDSAEQAMEELCGVETACSSTRLVATCCHCVQTLSDPVHLFADAVLVVVLDEADKMLSLGFEPQLTRLRRRLCPPQSRAPPAYQRPQVAPLHV